MYSCIPDYMVLKMTMWRRKKTGLQERLFSVCVSVCTEKVNAVLCPQKGHRWVVKTKCYKTQTRFLETVTKSDFLPLPHRNQASAMVMRNCKRAFLCRRVCMYVKLMLGWWLSCSECPLKLLSPSMLQETRGNTAVLRTWQEQLTQLR